MSFTGLKNISNGRKHSLNVRLFMGRRNALERIVESVHGAITFTFQRSTVFCQFNEFSFLEFYQENSTVGPSFYVLYLDRSFTVSGHYI